MAETALAASRTDRRVPPLLVGTILFLASELMFFGGLFASYFTLRAQTHPWPPLGVSLGVPLVGAATVLLVLSSFTMQAGIAGLRRGSLPSMRRWVWASFVLGAAFVALQLFDYSRLDFRVSSNAYGTIFYAMTGFHALHVIVGLLLMLILLGRAAQGAYAKGEYTGAEAVSYYWHFVDAVWIGLFATIYLIR
jgi:cytochrome c oxidase subunit 3